MPRNGKLPSPITGLATQDVQDDRWGENDEDREKNPLPLPCFIALRLTVCSLLRSTSPLKKGPMGLQLYVTVIALPHSVRRFAPRNAGTQSAGEREFDQHTTWAGFCGCPSWVG
jgi:hypothetical protein